MLFHWSQAIPWLLAAASLYWNIRQASNKDHQATEDRLRTLEVHRITDNLTHAHQLELMKQQVTAAQTAVESVKLLITQTLQNGN